MLKRCFDFGVALALLGLTLPVMAIVAVMIHCALGSPVLFRQQRPGLHGKPFLVYKFRTMADRRDSRGELLPDEARLTPLGRLLRRLSLDELPQLFNVLRGDMSLVGPRPPLPSEVAHYERWQRRRLSMKPGMTCHRLAIEAAARAGLSCYDFLAGADRYKRSLADSQENLEWLEIGPAWSPPLIARRLRDRFSRVQEPR